MLKTEEVKKELVSTGKYLIKYADQLSLLLPNEEKLVIEIVFQDHAPCNTISVNHIALMKEETS
jgi:hypothetical protein